MLLLKHSGGGALPAGHPGGGNADRAKRKREHSMLWFPEGFFLKKETSSNKNRQGARGPGRAGHEVSVNTHTRVGQDALGMK